MRILGRQFAAIFEFCHSEKLPKVARVAIKLELLLSDP